MDFDVTFCNKCQREEVKVCRHCSQSERDALRIAELNAEVERWHLAYNRAHEQAMENGSKLARVKAERDRYRMDLERIVNGSELKVWRDQHGFMDGKTIGPSEMAKEALEGK